MSFYKVSLLLLLFLFPFSNLFSQFAASSNWKSPIFSVEAVGSFDLPIQGARGNVGDFFRFQNYGTSVGWGGQFNFKFGLGNKGQYRPYVTLGYAQLEGRDDNFAFIDSNEIKSGYPLRGSQKFDSTAGSSKIILRSPFIGLGFEYAYTELDKKKRSFIPFAGVEFLVNIITGIYRQTPIQAADPLFSGETVAFTIKTDVRVGIAAGMGADWRLTKAFGLTFGFKYKIANLIGKKSDWLMDENKMNLLDQGAPSLNSYLKNDRNIAYMEFYLGACFFVGKTKN